MSTFPAFRSMRTLRALRPLRAVSRWEGMRVSLNTVYTGDRLWRQYIHPHSYLFFQYSVFPLLLDHMCTLLCFYCVSFICYYLVTKLYSVSTVFYCVLCIRVLCCLLIYYYIWYLYLFSVLRVFSNFVIVLLLSTFSFQLSLRLLLLLLWLLNFIIFRKALNNAEIVFYLIIIITEFYCM